MNVCMNYNKKARNYPNSLIFLEGENCLKISNMGKMKKRVTLYGFEPATLKTKVHMRITGTYNIRPTASLGTHEDINWLFSIFLFIDLSTINIYHVL